MKTLQPAGDRICTIDIQKGSIRSSTRYQNPHLPEFTSTAQKSFDTVRSSEPSTPAICFALRRLEIAKNAKSMKINIIALFQSFTSKKNTKIGSCDPAVMSSHPPNPRPQATDPVPLIHPVFCSQLLQFGNPQMGNNSVQANIII